MAARALSFCGAATLLVALVLAAAASASASEADAVADVEARLSSVVLPPGALPVGSRPDGVSAQLNGSPEEPASPNLVDRGGWWVVSGTAAEALSWFRSNPPVGAQAFGGGSLGGPEGEIAFLAFRWPSTAALASRTALVAAADRREGGAVLRIDTQAIWLEQHSASERVPAAARVIEVVWGRPSGHDSTAGSTNARFVRSIAAELDELPIVQPGVVHCPMIAADPPTATLRFRRRLGGTVLAEAKQSLPPGVCSPMGLTIRGERQPALTGAGSVIARLRKLR